MFTSRAHSAVHFVRKIMFANFNNGVRFLSVSRWSLTKNLYSESVLLSEKVNKGTRPKRNNKISEPSKLYPDEIENMGKYDLVKEFNFMDEDGDRGLMWKKPKSEELASEFNESEVDQELNIAHKKEEDNERIDLKEKSSDSESESDTDTEGYARSGKGKTRRQSIYQDLSDLHIQHLPKRSTFFRSEMNKVMSKNSGLILNNSLVGIFDLAKLGVVPKALFFCNPKTLVYFPASLRNISLYKIQYEDMKYWGSSERKLKESVMAVYDKENLKAAAPLEPKLPVTIVCDCITLTIAFSHLINSAYMFPPKKFISSQGCADPWSLSVLRNSYLHSLSLNHDFNLDWETIREKVDESESVVVVQSIPDKYPSEHEIIHDWSSVPSVNLYSHKFWDQENVTLIVREFNPRFDDGEALRFCQERKALRIDVGLKKRAVAQNVFDMVYFEMQRQWLATAAGEKTSKSRSKSGKTTKPRGIPIGGAEDITIR